MDNRGMLLSALGVGVGVGVGLGLASGGKWVGSNPELDGVSAEQIEQELIRQMIDGRSSNVTLDDFPYYVSEQTRTLLTGAAYVHLKHGDVSKFTRNLAPASRSILLSGPAELYLQMLAKALAHYFEAKLLLLDLADFSVKIQNKYGYSKKEKEPSLKRSISEVTLEKLSNLFSVSSSQPERDESRGSLRRHLSSTDLNSRTMEGSGNTSSHRRNSSASFDMSSMTSQPLPPSVGSTKRTPNWAFDEKLFLQALHKILVSVSKSCPVILYVRNVEELFLKSDRLYSLFSKLSKKLTGPVLVLGSRALGVYCYDSWEVDERLTSLFPYKIDIHPPEDEVHLASWKSLIEEDLKVTQFQDNKNRIAEVLAANDLVCEDLGSICYTDTLLIGDHIQEIVMSAVSYHLMNHKEADYRCGKLVISSGSLAHGLRIFQEGHDCGSMRLEANDEPRKAISKAPATAAKPELRPGAVPAEVKTEPEKAPPETKKETESEPPPPPQKDVPPDNEFEKRMRPEVIPANEIGVSFKDIGSLEETKESLQELVLLPLRRPDLFKGGLLKPCRGILLFGPPGTGKTMLAKAIANEAGASFINVSMSTITSKWFGEDEKNVRALFTLAAKVSPTIIFVDEVDSMLGQRTKNGEHEAMRKIKNEFMTHWDGLMTKPGEQILVLAATNRPFDLDDAIIRRFERRIMVGLPSAENREMILRTLLAKDRTDEIDFKELATMTEGYSGSDLKNLCITAAYRPVRDLIQKERKKATERKRKAQEKNTSGSDSNESAKEDEVITLRALNMEDMKWAKSQVAASFAAEGAGMNELMQWNELYGEGGTRKKEQLSYFL